MIYMMNLARRVVLVLLAAAYAIMWIGGVGRHWVTSAPASDDSWLAALFLTLAGLIVLTSTRIWSDRFRLFLVALVGFGSEVVGVHYGLPFGDYRYSSALGPGLLGVPVVMTFAWMTLAAYVKQMLLRLRVAAWADVMIGALWLTSFDLLIDPLAANELGYWRWISGGPYYGVPLINFAGWFVVSLLVFIVLRKSVTRNPAALLIGPSLILFFALIALAYGKIGLVFVGAGLGALHFFVLNKTGETNFLTGFTRFYRD